MKPKLEQLSRAAEARNAALNRRARKDERARERKEVRLGRGNEQLGSIENLAERNRAAYRRIENLVWSQRKLVDKRLKPNSWAARYILLKHPSSDDNPTGLAGAVWSSPMEVGDGVTKTMAVYITRSATHRVDDHPVSREETYGVYAAKPRYDEIMQAGYDSNPKRLFNPVGALSRYVQRRSISNHLDQLEETLAIFEQAASDPELNPELAAVYRLPKREVS